MRKKFLTLTGLILALALVFGIPAVLKPEQVSAQNSYKLIVPFPSFGGFRGATQLSGGPAEYIRTIYFFGLGFGTLLAFLMIVFGAVQYTVSEAVGSKQDASDRIKSAIWGLVLLLAAYVILETINPRLNIQNLQNPAVQNLPATASQTQNSQPTNNPGVPRCGNSILEPGERCDPPFQSFLQCPYPKYCSASCQCE